VWRKGWVMKISEVKEGESRKRGKVGLRVVARATHQYYEGAGVCAVQVRCVAVRTRRRWLADLASCGRGMEELGGTGRLRAGSSCEWSRGQRTSIMKELGCVQCR
jgi:hypothetical protein